MIEIRRLRPGDEAIVKLCVAAAAKRYPPFDVKAAYEWGVSALHQRDVAIFVASDFFAVAVTYERFWQPGVLSADVIFLCSQINRYGGSGVGQLRALARNIREWAIEWGCQRIDVSAETGVDLGPFARLMGPARQQAAYMVELSPKGM